jgi:alpha,alpha-trehalase
LVSLDGSIPWLCVPRFDGDAILCGLLDRDRGGQFRVYPDDLRKARQRYVPDTGLLVTELRTSTGLLRITDALAVRAGADLSDDAPAARSELVRSVVVIDGDIRVRVELDPRDGGIARPALDGLEVRPARQPELRLHLRANRPLTGLHTSYDLRRGEPTSSSRGVASTVITTSMWRRCFTPRPTRGGAG